MFTLVEKNDKIEAETLERNGELVIILRVMAETLTDDDEERIIAVLRRFVAHQKETPTRYHMVVDTHNVLVIPIERIVNLYNYLQRKEKYLRAHAGTTSYVIQGKVAEMALSTLNGMFDSWSETRTFQCYPTPGSSAMPEATYAAILAFIDSAAPPKAP